MISKEEKVAYPAVLEMHKDLVARQFLRCCFNCDDMNKDTNVCQKYKMQPPVRVMTFSCPEWTPEIPF